MTTETTDQQRNLHPHAEAILAMTMWGKDYSRQRGGSMDFWDKLTEGHKQLCRETVDRIIKAERAE